MASQNNLNLSERLKALNISPEEFQVLQRLDITIDDIEKLHQTVLWKAIQAKLQRRKENAHVLYNLLMAIKANKQSPHPDDRITNPSAISTAGQRPLYTDVAGKRAAYNAAVDNNEVAYIDVQKFIPLGSYGAEFNDVEYIAGLWRVQKKFEHTITKVRDREFVLVKKLPHTELTGFEFYSAAAIVWGGGGCDANVKNPDWIVAKYETKRGTYWAYGHTIEEVRAFLGVEIYYKNKDEIDSKVLMCEYSK